VKKFYFVVNFFYLNSNKKLLMWYKKWKKWKCFDIDGSRKYEKVKEKVHEQYTHYCVLLCNLTNKAELSLKFFFSQQYKEMEKG